LIYFLKSNWKAIGILVGIGLAALWLTAQASTIGKIWKVAVEGIQEDRKWIEEDLVTEINRLDGEREVLLKKIALLQTDKEKLKGENAVLDGQRCALEAKLAGLVVPSSVPDIVGSFHELGLGSARPRSRNLP
jgi:hypothetical protein